MRGDDDARVRPQRARVRQRLGLEHVEGGRIQLAGLEAGEDIGVDLQSAAAGVDQHRARQPLIAAPARQLGEQRGG